MLTLDDRCRQLASPAFEAAVQRRAARAGRGGGELNMATAAGRARELVEEFLATGLCASYLVHV